MIMQIPEEKRKNEPFLGVSGPAVCSFVSSGENVILLAQEVKPVLRRLAKWKQNKRQQFGRTNVVSNFPIWCFFKEVKYSVSVTLSLHVAVGLVSNLDICTLLAVKLP